MTYIVTADKNKGKTTYLENLARHQPDYFGGILSLAGANKDSYYAYNIESGEQRLLMSCEYNSPVTIGKYHCNMESFNWAEGVIKSCQKPAVIIDEVGRLELGDEGFTTVIKSKLNSSQDLYLSVRKQFIDAVVQHFEIKEYRVIEVDYK